VLVGVAAIALAGCTVPGKPPSVPPPTLPAGIGVKWIRDVGGTNDPDFGTYTPSYDRYVTTSSATTGPTPAGSVQSPLESGLFPEQGFAASYPDGTAKFPWNGFAGEGISVTIVAGEFTLSFPGGTCGLGDQVVSIMPSPDGTKAAILDEDINSFIPFITVKVVSLVNGSCPTVSSTLYGGIISEPGPNDPWEEAIGFFVWSPSSNAIVYPVDHHVNDSQPDQRALDRLDATSGATPQRVVPPVSGLMVPTGWSVANRLLVSEIEYPQAPVVASPTTLFTVNADGAGRRTIDTATASLLSLGEGWDYGYYVPGTDSIVYAGQFATVTNGDGIKFPRFRVQIVADRPNATAAPLDGTPPLVWHQVPIDENSPPTMTNAPNQDMVEGFTH
jgi:hypothetical protein